MSGLDPRLAVLARQGGVVRVRSVVLVAMLAAAAGIGVTLDAERMRAYARA